MHILLITHETSRTGAPRIAILVGRGLVAQGHEVNIVARSPGPLLKEFQKVAPTSIEPFSRVRRRLRSIRMLRLLAHLLDTIAASATLVRHRPDLLYLNSVAAAIYVRPARWLGLKTVIHAHESEALARRFLKNARIPISLRDVSIIACSPSVQLEIAELTGRPVEDVALLPSVPDEDEVVRLAREPARYHRAPEELLVGCCGSAEFRKGTDLWLRAAQLIREEFPDRPIRFVWIGGGNYLDYAGGPNTSFLGPLDNPYPDIRQFDVFTLPSRDDPFPLVVMEAMLLGRPVVAFRVGAVQQQVGSAGIIVPPEDVEEFARQILGLLNDPARRNRIGHAASAHIEAAYSSSLFQDSLQRLIEQFDSDAAHAS